MRRVLLLLLTFVAASARAQFVSIDPVPATPVAGAPFFLRVVVSGCVGLLDTSFGGDTFIIRVVPSANCVAAGGTLLQVNAGALPAGSYFVYVLSVSQNPPSPQTVIGTKSFAVSGVAGVPFPIRLFIGCVAGFPVSVGSPTINGTNIDFHVAFAGGCIDPFIPIPFDRVVGPLPPGTYTIRLFQGDSTTPFSTQPLQVIAAAPALDPRLLAMLAVAVIVIALLRMRSS